MSKLRILLVHNSYQQSGGEDQVFNAEKEMLLMHGHDVVEWKDNNSRLDQYSRISAAGNAIWSFEAVRKAETFIAQKKPDIVHIHNTWMMLSPSIYSVFHNHKLPVVQTLHNYRLLCPNAIFFRDNHVCEDCMKFPIPFPGVAHKCYRGSVSQSSIAAVMLSYHRLIGTWLKHIDFYIALSEFARKKFIQGGLPSQKILVKPNFLPAFKSEFNGIRTHVLYAGRISPEKGVQTLGHAWCTPLLSGIPLYVAGDGPEKDTILKLASKNNSVHYLGKIERASLDEYIMRSRFVIIPSVWYENFPMSILDAFRLGIPVISSRIGSLVELIQDGYTGLLFDPGNADDLAAKVSWLWNHPEESDRMGHAARLEYEKKYSPDRNYQLLISIYERAIAGNA